MYHYILIIYLKCLGVFTTAIHVVSIICSDDISGVFKLLNNIANRIKINKKAPKIKW